MKKIKIKSNHVVCAIIIGNLDDYTYDTHWLKGEDYPYYTDLLTEEIKDL